MSKVVISVVTEIKPPYHGNYQGKEYTIYEAVCEGTVDGANDYKINIKSGKEHLINGLAPGQAFECERKENKGFVSYKITAELGSGSAPAAGGTTGSGGRPAFGENRDKSFALSYAKDIAIALINKDMIVDEGMDGGVEERVANTTVKIADGFMRWLKEQ